jgi:hypothetical protein
MKTYYSSARMFVLLAILLIPWGAYVWGAPPRRMPAKPARHYTVTDLGPGIATDIDPQTNQVVGARVVGGQQVAERLSDSVSLGLLPDGLFSIATAIRNGRVTGNAGTGPFSLFTHIFLFEEGTLADLGTLGDFSLSSFATSINATRVICGAADPPDFSGIVPACVAPGAGLLQLATLGGANGFVNALTDSGDRCGMSDTVGGDHHATLWPAGATVPVDLHEGPGDVSLCLSINEAQQAVGNVDTADGPRGFVWTHATGMVPLAPLPGDTSSQARSINSAGDIVGTSAHGDDTLQRLVSVPVLWDAHGLATDLTDVIDTDHDCELEGAVANSDDGHIVVNGRCDGALHAFLLTPSHDLKVVDKPRKHGPRRHAGRHATLPVEASGMGKLDQRVLDHLLVVQPKLAAKLQARILLMQ